MLEGFTTLRNNTLAKIFSYHSLHQTAFNYAIIVLFRHLMIFSTQTEVHLQGAQKSSKSAD